MFFRCEARSPPRGWVCAFSSSSSPSSSPSTSASHSGCSSLSALTWSALASFHFVLETYYGCRYFNPLYQSGGGPLTFVPGGLKIEGSTQVIFFRTLMPPHACYPQHGCHKRLLATWWQTSWPLGPEGSPCVETGTSDDLKCKSAN